MLMLTQQRYLTSSSLASRFTPTYYRYETTKQSLSHRACKVWISLPNEVRFRYPLSTQTDPRVSVDDRVQSYNPIQKFKILLHAYVKSQTIITPLFKAHIAKLPYAQQTVFKNLPFSHYTSYFLCTSCPSYIYQLPVLLLEYSSVDFIYVTLLFSGKAQHSLSAHLIS